MTYDTRNVFENLARNNKRTNAEMFGILSALTDRARTRDYGSWFGSIHGILNHVMICDLNWLKRFRALAPGSPVLNDPRLDPPNLSWDHALHEDFRDLRSDRAYFDGRIRDWFNEFDIDRCGESFAYQDSGGNSRHAVAGQAFEFFFVHQVHHRGQVSQILDRIGLPNNFADNGGYLETAE